MTAARKDRPTFIVRVTRSRRDVNPREVFQCITRVSPRFRGYQQQDAQELLRTVLDELDREQREVLILAVAMPLSSLTCDSSESCRH